MALNIILGVLAVLSLALLLWQWLAARRFPLHQRQAVPQPDLAQDGTLAGAGRRSTRAGAGVTLLKPLKGADEHTEMCLRSWLTQDYGGPVQALFGVAAAEDPACGVVRRLQAEFPDCDAQLVICPETLGANAKLSKLIQIERLAKHEMICVSDADVRVPADFLTEAAAVLNPSLTPPGRGTDGRHTTSGAPSAKGLGVGSDVALVNSFYRLANPATLAMQCEAVAINADFWSQVLQSRSLKPMDFALGAAMLMRRAEVAAIGGFMAFADCLADDYQLGNRLARRGRRIELCPVVVECWDAPVGWTEVWKHQLRWARTIRVCQPGPYFFSILSNPTFWPLLWATVQTSRLSLFFFGGAVLTRILITADLQRRMAGRDRADSGQRTAEKQREPAYGGRRGGRFWLPLVKDLLQVGMWCQAFAGNTIEWRGRRMKLRADGTLIAD